jgi:hypothetical protein
VGTGYTQGFGMITPNVGIPSVAGAGIGVNGDIAYRINPHASIGVAGQYQEFTSENNSASRGFAGNLGITYHGTPLLRGDPWVRFGAGYRMLWSVNPVGPLGVSGPTVLVHGFELAALNIGYDVRLSEGVAIAPMIGADLTMFLWQDTSAFGNHALSSAELGTFVFAGIQGRFNAGPTTASSRTATSGGLHVW